MEAMTVPHEEMPQRKWLRTEYLPSLNGTALYIGVRWYCEDYWKLVPDPDLFCTVDIDPAQAHFGSPKNHYVCDATSLLVRSRYDHVSAFGLFGMPDSHLKTPSKIVEFLRLCASAVNDGGTLMFSCGTRTLNMEQVNEICQQLLTPDWIALKDWTLKPSPEHSEERILWIRRCQNS